MIPPPGTRAASAGDRLVAYLPGALPRWPPDQQGGAAYRSVDGTLTFVDISGFTRLTERLTRAGKVGAEEISRVLDTVFVPMLDCAFRYGADLIKWPGDAVLLLFDGDTHAARACAAAAGMRATLRSVGKIRGTSASANLRLSAGIHTGRILLFLAGQCHRELVLAGPAASLTAELEAAAAPGQIAVSRSTAALLNPASAGGAVGPGLLLRAAPRVPLRPRPDGLPATGFRADGYLPGPVVQRLRLGEPDGEHRRAAVGFIRFTGADELVASGGPDTLAAALDDLMGSAQQAAADNGVTFLETDICPGGGNIMLVAGAPSSPGRDEQRLLATVRAVLDRPCPLTLRAGVNAGRVFTGGLGPAYRRTFSVKGDAVNLAARLTARAAPGELLATGAVLDKSAQEYHTTAIPPFLVKGKARPVQAFHVAERRSGPARTAPESALVGRSDEIRAITEALAELRCGRGGVVEVTGEPGVGKSRLVTEMLAMAGELPSMLIRCSPDDRNTPYAVAGALLRALLGVPADCPPGAAVAAARAAILRSAPQQAPWLPLLATALGGRLPDTAETAGLQPAFRRRRIERAAVMLSRAVLPGPAVIAVEDTQFVDNASADLLARLAGQTTDLGWLVVLTAESPVIRLPDAAGRLHVAPLPASAAQMLLAALTEQAPLAPYRMAEIVRRAAGNPLFLRELAQIATSGGDITALPDSVEDVIVTQIDRLSPADRLTLRAAAVIGATFEVGHLSTTLGHPVDAATLAGLHTFVSPTAPGGWRFRHALVRDAAYEGLPFARRRHLHARVAAALEHGAPEGHAVDAAALSLHLFHAGSYRAAAHYARIAGDRAATAYANPEAAALFARGLDAIRRSGDAAPEESSRYAEALGDIRYRLGEFSAAAAVFAKARAGTRADPVAAARLCEKTALAVARAGSLTTALRWTARGRRLLAGLNGIDATRQDALLLAARAMLRYQQGRHAESASISRQAAAAAERCGARGVQARALFLRGAADTARGRRGGTPFTEQALAIWQDLNDLPWQARALNALGMQAFFESHWDRAVDLYRRAAAAFSATGDDFNAALTAGNIAEILADQGRHVDAEQAARPAERVLRASGALSETAFTTAVLARCAVLDGRSNDAILLLERARAGYAEAGEHVEADTIDLAIMEALLCAGRTAEALERATAFRARTPAHAENPHASALARIHGYAHAQLGETGQAGQELAAALRAACRRADTYDEVSAVDALLRLAAAAGEPADRALMGRRAELFGRLGVIALPAPPLTPTRPSGQ